MNTPRADRPAAPFLRLKVLALLGVAVLLVHLTLLQAPTLSLGLSQPEASQAFTTRAIATLPAKPPPALPTTPPRPAPAPPAPATTGASSEAAPTTAPVQEVASPIPSPPASAVESPAQEPDLAAVQPLAAPQRAPDRLTQMHANASLPGSALLKYKGETNRFPYSFNAELAWQQNGATYSARLALNVLGQVRTQTSQGLITPQGLAPLRFSDKYRSELAAHFDRDKGKVTFSANTPDAGLLAGAQDRLSILVQLGAMIAGLPGHYPSATTIAMQTIGPRDADTWLFSVGGHETLALPGGEQATLKLVRNPRQEFDQKVELWLAPALGYLPARIRITEANGDFIDQQWLATELPE
jgi:hypothetical protein